MQIVSPESRWMNVGPMVHFSTTKLAPTLSMFATGIVTKSILSLLKMSFSMRIMSYYQFIRIFSPFFAKLMEFPLNTGRFHARTLMIYVYTGTARSLGIPFAIHFEKPLKI